MCLFSASRGRCPFLGRRPKEPDESRNFPPEPVPRAPVQLNGGQGVLPQPGENIPVNTRLKYALKLLKLIHLFPYLQ